MSAWDTRVQDDWRTWRILDDEFERLVEARSETGVKALGWVLGRVGSLMAGQE